MSAAVAAKISDAILTNATIAEVRPAISQQCLNPSLRSIAKNLRRDAVIAQRKSCAMRALKLCVPSFSRCTGPRGNRINPVVSAFGVNLNTQEIACGGNNWDSVISSAVWLASSTERVMMSLHLPPPVDLYVKFENSGEVEALAGCFSLKATVRDEHRTYEGLTAIKEWKAETKKKYGHTIHPLDIADRDGKTVLKAELTGNFPGSPLTVEFSFVLENGKIVFLDIR